MFRSFDAVPRDFGPSIAVIGNFDGVHRGHQQILGAAAAEARSRGMRSIAITFQSSPRAVPLSPRRAEAAYLLAGTLAAAGHNGRRCDSGAGLRRSTFLHEGRRICKRTSSLALLQVRGIHEGNNFASDTAREAGVNELRAFGKELGFNVKCIPRCAFTGMEVSSSAVRSLIGAGDVRRARWMLGRVFGVHSFSSKGSRSRNEAVGTYGEPGAV